MKVVESGIMCLQDQNVINGQIEKGQLTTYCYTVLIVLP